MSHSKIFSGRDLDIQISVEEISGTQIVVISKRSNIVVSLPAFKEWFVDYRLKIEQYMLEYGVVLFKGFDISDKYKFKDILTAMNVVPAPYSVGNAPRGELIQNIYTASEWISDQPISLHNENSCDQQWPRRLYFCCEQPADLGGETIFADCRKVYSDMPDKIKNLFEARKIRYTRNLSNGEGLGVSWQNTFKTKRKELVEEICKNKSISYEWNNFDELRIVQVGASTSIHPESGEKVWFNQAHQYHPTNQSIEHYEALLNIFGSDIDSYPSMAAFSDGTRLSIADLERIRICYDYHSFHLVWESGDFVMIDNVLIAHGRMPFNGNRKILLALE